MRVLYVNHTSRVSGGELSLLGLLGALPTGLEATVACPEGQLAELLREQGVEVLPIRGTDGSLRLHPVRTPRALAEMGQAAIQVRRAAAWVEADLVHANSIRAGLVTVAATRTGERPSVVHVRDCLPPGRASALALAAIGRADALIANSAHTRAQFGRAAGAAHVVHNAVDISRFERPAISAVEARARLGLADRGPVLALIGQITPWKGQDEALSVVADLRRRHPRLQLLLVGSPKFDSAATRHDNVAYLAALRRRAGEGDLATRVSFLGEREDIPEILAAVDLLLAPSWEEPFGRAIVEAMAAGVPVAATSVGGPAEIVDHGRTGLLLPPRDPRLWSTAIGELLESPDQLAEMGGRGREEARRRFGLERHAAAIAAVYRTVLSAGAVAAG